MQRTILALLVVIVVAAGAAFGVARWLRCRSCAGPNINLHDSAWLQRELNLTEAQVTAVTKLEADYTERLAGICAAHCAARADLSAELGRPAVDSAQAADGCQRMCAAQADAEHLTLEHILKVRALLTPDQQARHAALVQRQLQGACPMGQHQP